MKSETSTMQAMLRDVGTLMRGAVLAQILGLLFMPVLSRLYTPSDFGNFGQYQAAILLVSVIACMRYDMAILTAPDEHEAVDLFRLCFVVSTMVSLAVFVGILLYRQSSLPQNLLGAISTFWLAPATFMSGMALASGAILTRLGAFGLSAKTKFSQSGANGVVAAGVGVAMPSPAGLVAGDIAGKLIAITMAAHINLRYHSGTGGATSLKVLASNYSSFPKLSVLGGLLNNGGSFLTPVLIYQLYGAHMAGQVALVDRAISLPLGLLIVTASQAFSSHYGRLLREDPMGAQAYFKKLVVQSAKLALLPIAGLAIVASTLFPLIFGPQWVDAGGFAQILAIMYFSSIVAGPVNAALVIGGKLDWQLSWEFGRLVFLMLFWISVAVAHYRVEIALAGYAAISTIVNFIFIALVWVQNRSVMNGESPPFKGDI